jgi:hypothetical protein
LYTFISCSLIEPEFYFINPSNPCHPRPIGAGHVLIGLKPL